MDLSMKWLNDYVKADMPIKEFCDGMTMSGSKVETYSVQGADITNVVVGKCVAIEKHPDADTLWVCKVDVGAQEPVQIVTSAQNVFEGAFLPVALHGATCYNHKDMSFMKIKKGNMRGIKSEGMMCSYEELNLSLADVPYSSADGILILNDDPDFDKMSVGMDIHDALGFNDTTVEFEITNNRPDCLSVLGLAREASATFDIPFNYVEPKFTGVEGKATDYINVEVKNAKLCSRYMAAVVKNVKIGPSPRWMAERLNASGVRSINNFVDITNYVMLEYGHPMHAFDLRYVEDAKIVVRNAEQGEKITILDGSEVALSPEMLIIADGKKPIAVAGVMGGEYSGIMDDTQTVVFESACFDGVSVRMTAKNINKRTDASSRFEKDIDPINAKPALMRALELVEMLGCGEVVREYIDIDNITKTPVKLKHDAQWISDHLGIDIPEQQQIDIFKKLGFTYEDGYLTAPNTRIDIVRQCDLAEEVARIYGYNKIPSTVPKLSSNSTITPIQRFEKNVVNIMVSQGFYETMTFSFISPRAYEKLMFSDDKKNSIVLTNPLGEDTSVMRTSMLPSMLTVAATNVANRNLSARMFEIGRIFTPTDDRLPVEDDVVGLCCYGADEDFYSVKGVVEELLDELVIDARFVPVSDNKTFHPGRCAEIVCGDDVIGIVGELHPNAAENYDISCRVYAAELYLEKMFNHCGDERKYKPLPKYPAMTRDLSLLCDDVVTSDTIIDIIKSSAKYLESVSVFDMYKGEQVPAGKKSLSYKLVLRKDGTMTDEEADASVERVLKALAQHDIVLRT
ncbi:MAG: phenylalanine--tRNA ligase subunit beta [Oscillospiraceae bacterium]